VFTEESKQKKRIANLGRTTRKTPITAEEIALRSAKTTAWALEKYQSTPFEQLGSENRKRRVLEEQEHKCNHCEIAEWNGKHIVLELEHKDGNTKNNKRTNLECICPNCHSQTETWRGRNNKGKFVSDEVLLEAAKKHNTISEALRSVGLPDKGSSHARAKRLLGQ
jgi:Zn finger protein HypA/HybF involved in hydrogenase expression